MSLIKAFEKEFEPEILEEFIALWSSDILLKRGDFLINQGERSPYLYFVEKGAIRIFYENEIEDLTIRFGYRNSFICVLPTFFNENSSEYSFQAIKASTVKRISRKDFFHFHDKHPSVTKYWKKAIEGLVLEQLEREIDILISDPIERYKRVLKRSPNLFQEIPLKYIASYIRMSPETLSRLRNS